MKKVFFIFIFLIIAAKFCFAGVSVIGELTQEKSVKPGDTLEGIILLKNTGKSPSEVKVYKTDYLFYSDGKVIYGEPGSVRRSNAPWLSLSPSSLTIHPEETVPVNFTVKVPERLDFQGTYWSMVMVEPLAETKPESMKEGKGNDKIGIQTIVRYGVQIVTDIGITGTRKIRFLDKKLISEGRNKVLQVDIENIGERWLSPFVWVELYNEEGTLLQRLESGRQRIYPGCSVRHKLDFTKVPRGKYKALVIADNEAETVFGAQYDVQVE